MEAIQQASPLRVLVADRVRAAIISGALEPGASLGEKSLAEELGVSRTPTREGLVQLAIEGFVVSLPAHGFRVAPLSIEDGIQLERLIASLEKIALEDCPPMSAGDLAEIRRMTDAFRDAKRAEDRQDLDDRWHNLLIRRCTNRRTLQCLADLRNHLRRYNRAYLKGHENHERSCIEHEELVDALQKGDRAHTCELLENHWLGGITRALRDNQRFDTGHSAKED